MLLSPGHSPRHLSTPSPNPTPPPSLQTPSASSSSLVNANPPPPPPPPPPRSASKRKATVLDEDSYVAAIEKIIERDYFPDIPKLRDRLDWLEAVRTGDPLQIRDAQLKIIERRRAEGKTTSSSTTLHADTQAKSRTPGSTFFRANSFTPPFIFEKTPAGIPNNVSEPGEATGGGQEGAADGDAPDVSLSLDDFLRRYTSEDNDSFSKILEKVNRKKRDKYAYLLEGVKKGEDGATETKSIEDASRDRITDGYGSSYQPPSTLQGWNYTAKNLLMYHPSDNGETPLTDKEKEERLQGLTKEINRASTRFHGKILDSRPKDDNSLEVIYTPVAGATPLPFNLSDRERDKSKKYDLEDLRKTPNKFYVESDKKADNGYSFVKTPSPAPGVDESPFITWGEIEGTPLRLDPEDTPIDIGGSADGPHFRIPNLPSRDLKAQSLSREASRKLRERSKLYQKPPLPSPVRSGSASPSVRTMSRAAQKFVRNAIAKSSSTVDESLRASYRGTSPSSMHTPKSTRSISRLSRGTSPTPPTFRSPSI